MVKQKKSDKTIIVGGAGHGGLAAAAQLAKNGYDVTVFECNCEKDLGYDWDDFVDNQSYEDFFKCGCEKMKVLSDISYISPNKQHSLKKLSSQGGDLLLSRKHIYKYLLSNAKNCGVKFRFGESIAAPLVKANKVCGVVTTNKKEYPADLVIDACGLNSPIRKQLPTEYFISKDITGNEIICVYRCYFKRSGNEKFKNKIYLCHMQDKGISWVIEDKNHLDVLIGKFGSLSKEDIHRRLKDLKADYPNIANQILLGGKIYQIPVRAPLPVFVGDNYVALGDSAAMTCPLSGSGIALSIASGNMLAESILGQNPCNFEAKDLWVFQTKFMKKFGLSLASRDVVKRFLSTLSHSQIDFLLDKKIITENDLAAATQQAYALSLKQVAQKFIRGISDPSLMLQLGKLGIKNKKVVRHINNIPLSFDCNLVNTWAKKYEQLLTI